MRSGTLISSKSLYMLRGVKHELQNNLRAQQPVIKRHGCCRLKKGGRSEEIREKAGLMLLAVFEEHANHEQKQKMREYQFAYLQGLR